jgi:hypothetical protein
MEIVFSNNIQHMYLYIYMYMEKDAMIVETPGCSRPVRFARVNYSGSAVTICRRIGSIKELVSHKRARPDRVTRLGEFSPIGRLFTMGSFVENHKNSSKITTGLLGYWATGLLGYWATRLLLSTIKGMY